jgi:malonate-semialdehyde dehydrogenase (acetylating)/methylmalonate-semialdehyde dehydrogenase
MGAAYGSCGERCMAACRRGGGRRDRRQARRRAEPAIDGLKVGAFDNDKNDMGPLITPQHRDKVVGFIDSASSRARSWWSMAAIRRCRAPDGFFVGGTLFDGVKADMDSYRNEIFGPVLQVLRVQTMQEAMA